MGVKQEELNMDNVETNTVTETNAADQSVAPQVVVAPQGSEHTFTQEQLNSIISSRINPLNQKVAELSSQLAKAEKLTAQYHEELEGYKHKEIALKEGIPNNMVDYAIYSASKMVSKEKTFEDALKEFKASNEALFGVTQQAGGTEDGSTQADNKDQQAQGNTDDKQVTQQSKQIVNMQSGSNATTGAKTEAEAVQEYLKDRLKRR